MKQAIVLFTGIFFFISCSEDHGYEIDANYEASSINMQKAEKKNPAAFLTVKGEKKKNLIGQTVVKGSIFNSAKIVIYKDVDIKLSFYSKTGAVLEEDREMVYARVAPGSQVNFKSKYFTPKGTDSIGFKVVGAKF